MLSQSESTLGFFARNPNLTRTLTVLTALYGLNKSIKYIKNRSQKKRNAQIEQIAAEYQKNRDNKVKSLEIPSLDQLNFGQDQVEKIISSSASNLAQMLKRGEVTSENLVNAFAIRCQTIGHEYKAITEMNYEQAIQLARECDQVLQKLRENDKNQISSILSSSSSLTASEDGEDQQQNNGQDNSNTNSSIEELYNQKPLFGVPVSIKDIIEMKGFAVTVGCISRKDKIVQEDSLIIKLIKNSGAIPLVRSNIPQLNMSSDCYNRLFGRTCNAWDKSRYSGGSSGGEAVLLATRCSPLGFGTDIGGSIRIPASLNGVVGFKPTSGRTPFKGLGFVSNCIAGQLSIRTSLGPMSRFVDDVAIGMKVITDEQFIQSQKASQKGVYQPIIGFDMRKYQDRSKKYRIGYIKNLQTFEASPSFQRAVDISVQALREQGHELVPIELPFEKEITELYFNVLSSDNNRRYLDQLEEEEYIAEYDSIKFIMNLSSFAKKCIIWLLRKTKQFRSADLMEYGKSNRSAEDFMIICGKINSKREEIIKYFENLKIDAIVTPGQPLPAFGHGLSPQFIIFGSVYTHIWNTLNFSAGVLPITTVQENEQTYDNCKHNDNITKLIQKHIKNTAGLPVSAQVVTFPYEEELCLNLMKQIEEKVNFYQNNKTPI
ncbi:hypothetical protein ABPG74_000566 [Tetrahymena malaccensis]